MVDEFYAERCAEEVQMMQARLNAIYSASADATMTSMVGPEFIRRNREAIEGYGSVSGPVQNLQRPGTPAPEET